MNRAAIDLWVGFFVLAGLAGLFFLAFKAGNLSVGGLGETYTLNARFDNIGGLKPRAAVKSSGVVVGRVGEIRYDAENYTAQVSMLIDTRYHFPRDTFATINTSGLLGEQYIGFDVGGDDRMLNDGDFVSKTQSALVLEKLIGQFMLDKATEPAAP